MRVTTHLLNALEGSERLSRRSADGSKACSRQGSRALEASLDSESLSSPPLALDVAEEEGEAQVRVDARRRGLAGEAVGRRRHVEDRERRLRGPAEGLVGRVARLAVQVRAQRLEGDAAGVDVRDVVVRLGRGRGAELLNLGIGAAKIILGDLVRGFEEQGLEQEPGF